MVYGFDDYQIDKFKTFEKGGIARALFFSGLSAYVESLFSELILS